MLQPLDIAKIDALISNVKQGGVDSAIEVYKALYAMGYNYAG